MLQPQSIADLTLCNISIEKLKTKAEFWYYNKQIMEALIQHLAMHDPIELMRACANSAVLADARRTINESMRFSVDYSANKDHKHIITCIALKRDDYYRRTMIIYNKIRVIQRGIGAFRKTAYFARVSSHLAANKKADLVVRQKPYALIDSLLAVRSLDTTPDDIEATENVPIGETNMLDFVGSDDGSGDVDEPADIDSMLDLLRSDDEPGDDEPGDIVRCRLP